MGQIAVKKIAFIGGGAMAALEEAGIEVCAGAEGDTDAVVEAYLKDCSVVTATYELGEGMKGTIGIIGPKRMDYENVMDNLKTLKNQLDGIFKKPPEQK